MNQTSRDRVNSRRVRTHEKNSGDAVRRLGTIIPSIFCAQSEARIRLTVWKWFVESRYPGAFPSSETQGRDESLQAWAEEPWVPTLTGPFPKRSSECWLLIGHKKCYVLLCPIREQHLLSSFREFVQDGYYVLKCV